MIWLRKYLCHKWPNNHGFGPFFTCCKNFPILSSTTTYHRVFNYRNKTDATSGTRTAYTSGTREFTSGFSWVRVARSLVFCVVFCRSLFVLLSFFYLVIALSVLLRMRFLIHYQFDIFKRFWKRQASFQSQTYTQKDWQHNGQTKKNNITNNYLQNPTQITTQWR